MDRVGAGLKSNVTDNEGGSLPSGAMPRGARLLSIVRPYGPLKHGLRCGRPECPATYKKGFVVEFLDPSSGRPTTGAIGHVCGRKFFGEDWKDSEDRYNAAERLRAMEEVSGGFVTKAAECEPQLQALLPELEQMRIARAKLLAELPSFMQACAGAHRQRDGWLVQTVRRSEHRLHRLSGSRFFAGYEALDRARDALAGIWAVRKLMADGKSTPVAVTKQIRLNGLADLSHLAVTVEREAEAARAALDPAHLRKSLQAFALAYPDAAEECRWQGASLAVLRRDRMLKTSGWIIVSDFARWAAV